MWALLDTGVLPDADGDEAFRRMLADDRRLPDGLDPVIAAVAGAGAPLGQLRTVLSAAGPLLGLGPLLDLDMDERRRQARRLAAIVPAVLGALHRRANGLDPVAADPDLGHAAAYLHAVTGRVPEPTHARALEQYLILTIDHGFNASTFTGRVVASTGADWPTWCAVRSARSRARSMVALRAGRSTRSMPSGRPIEPPTGCAGGGCRTPHHGVRPRRVPAPDPRSRLLREVAEQLGGPLVEQAIETEANILTTLAELKPGRPLPSNVEFYAGVIMETVGLPRSMFTPTFAVSRTVGWVTHALEQAAVGKLIRPAARYVGPEPQRAAVATA